MPMCDWEVVEKYAPIVAENEKLKYENEILRDLLQNRNHVLGVAEPTYQPILDENEKLKEEFKKLKEEIKKLIEEIEFLVRIYVPT